MTAFETMSVVVLLALLACVAIVVGTFLIIASRQPREAGAAADVDALPAPPRVPVFDEYLIPQPGRSRPRLHAPSSPDILIYPASERSQRAGKHGSQSPLPLYRPPAEREVTAIPLLDELPDILASSAPPLFGLAHTIVMPRSGIVSRGALIAAQPRS